MNTISDDVLKVLSSHSDDLRRTAKIVAGYPAFNRVAAEIRVAADEIDSVRAALVTEREQAEQPSTGSITCIGAAMATLTKLGYVWNGGELFDAPKSAEQPQPSGSAVDARVVDSLKDPEFVYVNMLRGTIARPTMRQLVGLHGEVPNGEDVQLARIAELQAELAALRTPSPCPYIVNGSDGTSHCRLAESAGPSPSAEQ